MVLIYTLIDEKIYALTSLYDLYAFGTGPDPSERVMPSVIPNMANN